MAWQRVSVDRRLVAAWGLRRPQQCGETFPGPNLSADRFAEDLGSRRSPDLAVAELRDRDAGRGGELGRTGATEPGPDRKSRSDECRVPDDPGHGFHRGAGLRRSRAHTTGTSSPPVFTLCCFSMRRVIVWRPSCGRAMVRDIAVRRLATASVPNGLRSCRCIRRSMRVG